MSVLTRAIEDVPGVGPQRAAALRQAGIRCVSDLIRHLPFRYETVHEEATIEAAYALVGPTHGAKEEVTATGELAVVRPGHGGRRPRFEATLEDGTGTVRLVWFNAPWMRGRLHPGMRLRVTGRAQREGEYLQMVNPRWEPVEDEPLPAPAGDDLPAATLRPVYPALGDLGTRVLGPVIDGVLDEAVAAIDDHLAEAWRSERGLPELRSCYVAVHRSDDRDTIAAARRRLAYDELLMLQLAVMLKRRHRVETLRAPALPRTPAIDAHVLARLPFDLTEDQRAVVDEIAADLDRPVPMNRLLQGDVGAGKTVVALYAMLLAVAEGAQAALMAPTELLAEQHHASIGAMLTGSQVRIELLTGSLPAAERRATLARIEAGEADLVIGTHALLTESVGFANLALVIIDEQHRFGVHQRASLRTKGGGDAALVPHVLVMTATPIPRTLSLTVFGDLDVSTIRRLPPGRTPVRTRAVPRARSHEVYDWVAGRVRAGEQAYVVVPVIDESPAGLTDVVNHLEHLRQGAFRGLRVEAVHGRLRREERDAIMSAFRAGEVHALIATTVIEVGVDVPNATMMVIEHAERFGLAQLHQLRGRVGRGAGQSVCALVADPTTEDGQARIDALLETTDGFRIAERDLEIRGPGELFGARQSGIPPFLVARLPGDFELLRLARRDAIAWVERSPRLADPDEALLRRRLLKAYGESLGLGDVG